MGRGRKPTSPRNAPGHDGRFELGERVIDDPLEPGHRHSQIVNVRESAIEHMASRGRLNTSQRAAAERFRKLWELAAIGRERGIDPTSMGGGHGLPADPMTDDLVHAGAILAEAMRALGMIHSRILTRIIGEGKLIEQVAGEWSRGGGIVSGRRAEGYVTGTLIDAIDELVHLWRLEAKGAPRPQDAHFTRVGVPIMVKDCIRASGPMTYTGPAKEISVGKFGDAVTIERRGLDRGPLTPHTSGNLPSSSPHGRKK